VSVLFRRRPRLTPEQVLASRPLRNPALKTEPIEGGGMRLHVRRRGDWWVRVLGAVFPIPRERVVELDAVGEEVWELCDGEHTLREMTRVFQERHKLTRAEAEWSLRTYLRDLGKRNLVAFAVEKTGREGEESEGVVVGSAGEGEEEGERAHGKRA
jgi:hypothetical protein